MFMVNIKNTRMTSLLSFEHISHLFLVFPIEFEQVNVSWEGDMDLVTLSVFLFNFDHSKKIHLVLLWVNLTMHFLTGTLRA